MPTTTPARGTAPASDIRRELAQETRKILRLKTEIARNFWDLGNSLSIVNNKKLYLAAGHDSFEKYLQKEVKIGRSTAYRLMELSRNFSRETASQFSQEKLLGAIAYAKATPEEDRPIDVTRYEFEVRTPSGKKTKKTFEKVSSKELKRAAANLRRRKKPVAPIPTPSISGLTSGKQPRLKVAAFLTKARQVLKDLSPRPKVSLTAVKPGADPLVELRLSNLHASSIPEALGLLTAAAWEAWMQSIS
jgi:hypothetical protein